MIFFSSDSSFLLFLCLRVLIHVTLDKSISMKFPKTAKFYPNICNPVSPTPSLLTCHSLTKRGNPACHSHSAVTQPVSLNLATARFTPAAVLSEISYCHFICFSLWFVIDDFTLCCDLACNSIVFWIYLHHRHHVWVFYWIDHSTKPGETFMPILFTKDE